jgi:Cytochrome C'
MKKLVPLCLLFLACESKSPAPSVPTGPSASAASAALSSNPPPDTGAGPQRALDALDGRTPVPLLPMMANHQKQNMRDHLVVVQQVVAGVAKGDFKSVEKAVERLVLTPEREQMCRHMGMGASGFTEAALQLHLDAEKLAEAARNKDGKAVLSRLSDTLTQCTSCHETFKQRVVDAAEWSAATGAPAPLAHD